ncbi:MAG: hypothetical protein WAP52_02310 [Candidatus Sungiibacteriota bacterium]
MEKFFHPSTALETLLIEGLRTLGYLEKIEGMARVGQSMLSGALEHCGQYDLIIRYAQEASAHLQAMFEAVGKVGNPTTLH